MTTTIEQILEWLREGIEMTARGGYETDAEVLEYFEERVRDEFREHPPEVRDEHLALLMDELRAALRAQREAEATWTDKTINDLIDDAFGEIEEQGIIALQNAGYTMSDGWSDVGDERARWPEAWGAVFFHGQDVESGVNGSGVMLAFGAFVKGEQHESESLRVARTAVEILEKHGVPTDWDGSIQHRVWIKPFEWKKRRYTKAP